MESDKFIRIALIGSYGNGKTSLAKAINQSLDIPISHASPMHLDSGVHKVTLENCTAEQLFELTIQRYTERLENENSHKNNSYVSDGSIMHEWVYLQTRLENGLFPLHESKETEKESPYSKIAHAINPVPFQFAKRKYSLIVLLPNELKLQDNPPPISEHFRFLLNDNYKRILSRNGVPFIEVSGSIEDRLEKVLNHLNH